MDSGTTRREFLASAGALGLLGTALTGISWLMAAAGELETPPKRRPLVVKPIFLRILNLIVSINRYMLVCSICA